MQTCIVQCYLRNGKHVPCCYKVVETRVEVWETEKCCGNTSRRLSQTFTSVSITRQKQRGPRRVKGKQLLNFDYQNANINSVTARARSVSPSSYTNTIFNQSACLLSQVFFKYDILFVSCKILRTSKNALMLVVQMWLNRLTCRGKLSNEEKKSPKCHKGKRGKTMLKSP